MTTHTIKPLDGCSPHRHHPTLYSNRIYARTTTTTTTTTRPSNVNRPFHSYLKTFPPINICENLLYDVAIAGDVGSATSSSYIASTEHYDNTCNNTYDNPIQYFENYPSKSIDIVSRSSSDLPHSNDNLYDHAKDDTNKNGKYSPNTSRSTSPVLFYLENKNLVICACIISLLLLVLIGLGIFLLNKLIRPVIINTTVNNHYGMMNMTNTTTTTTTSATIPSRSIISKALVLPLRRPELDILTTTITTLLKEDGDFLCPPNRWGRTCENICKPCGLGACHPTTGNCICPEDMYGEYCDLWKVNDKPKRGDMMT